MSMHKSGNGRKKDALPFEHRNNGQAQINKPDQKRASAIPNGLRNSFDGYHAPIIITTDKKPGLLTSSTAHAVAVQDDLASRRVRVNRILLRKRRHHRMSGYIGKRLMITVAILFLTCMFFTASSVGGSYAYYQAQLPFLKDIARHSLFQTTHIYDRNGKLLYALYNNKQAGSGRRTYIGYNQISPLLVNATIAAEDHTFWTNSGVDFLGIVRAAISDAQNQGAVEGGSTITQQLIKKQFFDGQPRTIPLKGEEALLATGLTQQYPKWEIMEMYLNTVFYGSNDYGAEAAAQDYFGLQPQCTRIRQCEPAVAQLDLAQSALLAGLPQSPTGYNPIEYKSNALQRQKVVLNAMVGLNMITNMQALDAEREMANYTFVSHSAEQPEFAPHFVNYVIDVLTQILGAQNLYAGGYSVYTTLDYNLEQKVEQSVYNHIYQPQADNYLGYYGPLDRTNNVNNAAAVVMDPKTGEILAMDGSANYNIDTPGLQGQDNVATSSNRQPGSSFKPIVYATAFEMGWYPAMVIPDHPTYFPYPTGNEPYYAPLNYDRQYHTGFPMTVRQAIGNSYNIPAVNAMEFAGHTNVQNTAARLGLTEIAKLPTDQVVASAALGAIPVSLLHMTGAYATFANQGVRMPTTAILQIDDNEGKTIYNYNPSLVKGVQAIRPDVAFLMSNILSDKTARYHEFSPGNPLELPFPVAAKTGTSENFRDNWTLGYTPNLAVGVWAGNSDNSAMINSIGITGAGPIWKDIMEFAMQNYQFPPDNFVRPADVQPGTVSALTGLAPVRGQPTTTDWFIKGTLPTIAGVYFYAPFLPTPTLPSPTPMPTLPSPTPMPTLPSPTPMPTNDQKR